MFTHCHGNPIEALMSFKQGTSSITLAHIFLTPKFVEIQDFGFLI
jgi:hypothetical protein